MDREQCRPRRGPCGGSCHNREDIGFTVDPILPTHLAAETDVDKRDPVAPGP
jgi:hypothetical protein